MARRRPGRGAIDLGGAGDLQIGVQVPHADQVRIGAGHRGPVEVEVGAALRDLRRDRVADDEGANGETRWIFNDLVERGGAVVGCIRGVGVGVGQPGGDGDVDRGAAPARDDVRGRLAARRRVEIADLAGQRRAVRVAGPVGEVVRIGGAAPRDDVAVVGDVGRVVQIRAVLR